MNRSIRVFVPMSLLGIIILTACSFPAAPAEENTPTLTPAPESTSTQELPTEVPTKIPVPTATSIQHQNFPGELPVDRSNHAGDHDSSSTADQKRAPGGDRFTFGRFERPFNADTMELYYPYLDIEDTQYFQDETWIYTVITMVGKDENQTLSGRYAVEFDADLDGGGDWLVLVEGPLSPDWSVEGVQVWLDTNDDVGGSATVNADDNPSIAGNGYETELFRNGLGDDPDLAWARISPQDSETVQIVVKRSLLAGDDSYMAGAWAGNATLDPAMFDLNDRYTHEQAGAALIELEYFYPIKELAEVDNSCRVPIGFQPTTVLPGTCPIAPEEKAACPAEYLICYNFGQQQLCFCYAP